LVVKSLLLAKILYCFWKITVLIEYCYILFLFFSYFGLYMGIPNQINRRAVLAHNLFLTNRLKDKLFFSLIPNLFSVFLQDASPSGDNFPVALKMLQSRSSAINQHGCFHKPKHAWFLRVLSLVFKTWLGIFLDCLVRIKTER
jgi:hypothetical protein